MTFLKNLTHVVNIIRHHPLTRSNQTAALIRFARWQIAQRLFPAGYVVPFVSDTRLLAERGMVSATGNIYCGLMEYEDMGFVMHLLRPGDVFCDIGANVGIFTVIAAGVSGAHVVAVEPVPTTADALEENVHLNRLSDLVRIERVVIGDKEGSAHFRIDGGTSNHVSDEVIEGKTLDLPMQTLSQVMAGQVPYLIKVDVEGFEWPVLKSAEAVLSDPACQVLIVETNGSGVRYDIPDEQVGGYLEGMGFKPHTYDPRARRLIALDKHAEHNTIYIKDVSAVTERVTSSEGFNLKGETI